MNITFSRAHRIFVLFIPELIFLVVFRQVGNGGAGTEYGSDARLVHRNNQYCWQGRLRRHR